MVPVLLAVLGVLLVVLVLQKRGNKLLRNGVPGVAVILSVQQTAARDGGRPVANIALEVTPREGPGFQAVAQQVILPANSYLFQTGKQVPVRFDRANRSNIIIVTDP
jgi:hypothetical protein